jgi:hypothetical protein
MTAGMHDLAIKAMRPLHGSATLVNVNDAKGHVGGARAARRSDCS